MATFKLWEDENKEKCQERGCSIELNRRCMGSLIYVWSLTFMWDDGYEATYEAFQYEDKLTPRWNVGGKEKYEWSTWGTYTAKKCSPLAVNVIAKTMRIGDMVFTLFNINSQEWATALARRFGVNLPPGTAKILRFGSEPEVTYEISESPGKELPPGMVAQFRDIVGERIANRLVNN